MSSDDVRFRTPTGLRAGELTWQIFPPIFICLGTFGNILSIIVLSKPYFRRWASSVFLIGLSAADLSILYIGLLRQWIKYVFDFDIRYVSGLTCKVHWWLMYMTADCSVWILVSITIDRLVSTILPYKSKDLCNVKTAFGAMISIVVAASLINGHMLYGLGRLEISEGNTTVVTPCAPITNSYNTFFEKVWTWIDLCKFSVIPFVILCSGNVCIIYKLVLSRRKVRPKNEPSSHGFVLRSTRIQNMSILLVALNFQFVLCTLPIAIYLLGQAYWIPKSVPRAILAKDPWWAFVNVLYYVNNISNFLFYCLSGSRFRRGVRQLFSSETSQFSTTARLT